MKIARRINPTQTKERKEIFASLATFLYKQRGTVMRTVDKKMTISLFTKNEKKLESLIPVTLMRTLVTVSPTTTLYDTIAGTQNYLLLSKT